MTDGAPGNWGPFLLPMRLGGTAPPPKRGFKTSPPNRIFKRQLRHEFTKTEEPYLSMRDLKSDGALGGQPLSVVVPFDYAVESLAAAMQHLRKAISLLDVTTNNQEKQG